MEHLTETLLTGPGYAVWDDFIPIELIDAFTKRIPELYPVRASSSAKEYAEREDVSSLNDIAVWWSQTVLNFPEVEDIESLLTSTINYNFTNLRLYTSDVAFINPHTNWINPHVDTPYRFKKYNFDHRLLGIQCIISLFDMPANCGSTGVVPFSQKRDFDIDRCYAGQYDNWFLENYKQPALKKGSVLVYNSRILHSSMPNNTNEARPALLINYCHLDIIDDIRRIDNIWKSNE